MDELAIPITEGVEGLSLFTPSELDAAMTSADPVHLMSQRIHRALTSRYNARGWKTPPPICNRVYIELAQGMLSYNAALKLKEVQMPFGLVQVNALLLVCSIVLTPVSIACFSSTVSMAVWVTVATVGGFVSMWLVANEAQR